MGALSRKRKECVDMIPKTKVRIIRRGAEPVAPDAATPAMPPAKAPTRRELGDARAKAELALMGLAAPVRDREEAERVAEHIVRVMGASSPTCPLPEDLVGCALKLSPEARVTHIATRVVCDMRCIVFCLEMPDEPRPFEEDYGTGYPCAFCYVMNADAHETCSEYGDVFFKRRGNFFVPA